MINYIKNLLFPKKIIERNVIYYKLEDFCNIIDCNFFVMSLDRIAQSRNIKLEFYNARSNFTKLTVLDYKIIICDKDYNYLNLIVKLVRKEND